MCLVMLPGVLKILLSARRHFKQPCKCMTAAHLITHDCFFLLCKNYPKSALSTVSIPLYLICMQIYCRSAKVNMLERVSEISYLLWSCVMLGEFSCGSFCNFIRPFFFLPLLLKKKIVIHVFHAFVL